MRRLLPVLIAASLLAAGAASASAAPSITSISPTHGKSGTAVTVSGSGFTGATAVWFGTDDYPGTALRVSGDTKLVVKAPSGILGGTKVDVRVVGAAGDQSPVAKPDVFTYDAGAGAGKIKEKGTHGPENANFIVRFSGHGTWSSSFKSSFDHNNLSGTTSFVDTSSYSWDWAMDPTADQTLLVYATCGGGGAPNLCKAIGPSVSLSKGKQELDYSVNDVITDSVDPTQTAKCTDSLSLRGGKGASIGLNITPTEGGKALVFSSLSPSPLAGSNGNDDFFDGSCKGLDTEQLWMPGGDGSQETKVVDKFFSFKLAAVPTRVLQTHNVITIPVHGPSSGNGPERNCGTTVEHVSCLQTGGWVGTITLTRVRL